MLKRIIPALLVLGTALAPARTSSAQGAPSAVQMVAAADKIRNPSQPFRVSLSIVEYVKGVAKDQTGLVVHAKMAPGATQYKNVVEYTQPTRDVGKLVLLNGSTMWFYDPAAKSSIRLSAQQRLTGQASQGDVLTVNLAQDYTSKILGEEEIQDADRAKRNTWHLELTKSTNDAMYAKLEYWVEKDTYRPIKAKFYSDSGRVLKLAFFRRYEKRLDVDRPTETIIIDGVDPNLVTKITYSDTRPEDVQDAWFQRDYLPRFKGG
jgi:hypothetical protein